MEGSSDTTTSALMERRLKFIERQLGLEAAASASHEGTTTTKAHDEGKDQPQHPDDLVARLRRVEARWRETVLTVPKLQSTHDAWVESLRAMDELDPGTALTHQQQVAAPLLYRRQEVLANAADLSVDFRRLSTIVSLLLIGQGGGQGGGMTPVKSKQGGVSVGGGGKRENITASQVSNAPILVEPRVSDEDMASLVRVAESLRSTQERVDRVTTSLDRVLHQYQSTVAEIAEKTVLLDAELSRRGV